MKRVSRVGFNSTCNQALVYVSMSCGPLCGGGWYVVLDRDGERWRVVLRQLIWVS